MNNESNPLLFLPISREAIGRPIERAADGSPELLQIAESYRDNLYAVSVMGGLPLKLGAVKIQGGRLSLLAAANELEGYGEKSEHTSEEIKREAVHKALDQLREMGPPPQDAILRAAEPLMEPPPRSPYPAGLWPISLFLDFLCSASVPLGVRTRSGLT